MTVNFFFDPEEFEIIPLWKLRKYQWKNIPDSNSLETIISEYQYLLFHFYLIHAIRHTKTGRDYVGKLDWGIRSCIVKIGIIMAASIVEHILLAHALKRKYKFKKKRKTFGIVIEAWENSGAKDIDEKYWKQILWLKDARDNIHLEKLNEAKDHFYEDLKKNEEKTIKGTLQLLDFLQKLKSES